ncbi:MAG: 6-phosphofructokinase, partial [Acidobacteria bacterium]|nr:6-phosphofructokinase [Acidobacteriota bacterium]
LNAARNLIKKGIDRLIVIGGDGTLTGANEFREEWPNLLQRLAANNEISQEEADRYPRLALVGLAGSINNDMYDIKMTIGADTALHRISHAVDAINSTASSHQRIFVVETMGRQCGYLALMGSLITGADWVLIPEKPTEGDWKTEMIEKLRIVGEEKRAIIVMLAEGATDHSGEKINSKDVANALEEGLKKPGEDKADVRVTILGHVQRGGAPSAHDRILSTLLGYGAVKKLLTNEPFENPLIVVNVTGAGDDNIKCLPLKTMIENNNTITSALKNQDYNEVFARREKSFREAHETIHIFMKPGIWTKKVNEAPAFAVLNSGAAAPGMNTAVRAAVKLAINKGYRILGIERGFEGLISGNIKTLDWYSVDRWTSLGGAELGVSRKTPDENEFSHILDTITKHNIQGLLIIGGWSGYEGASKLRGYIEESTFYKPFPIICIPASISNNLPGTEISIGADTALNNIVDALDKIKQSAVAARRCFVVEVMGKYCGYLALMSGLATGAEYIYLHEEPVTLEKLQETLTHLKKEFNDYRRLALVIRNENAYKSYDTKFMTSLFNEEGCRIENEFDARQAILGHLQQGGNPSPFDRILATRFTAACINFLVDIHQKRNERKSWYAFAGLKDDEIIFNDLMDFDSDAVVEKEFRRAKEPWWMTVKPIVAGLNRRPCDDKYGF